MIDMSAVRVGGIWGRLIRLPLRLIPKGALLPILTGPLRGKRWVVGSGTHGCWLGTYERHKQERFARAIAPAMTVYDIGANVGLYTLIAADRVGDSGRVVAFEPVPANVRFLHAHLKLNGFSDRTNIVEAAVSDRKGEACFDLAPDRRFEGRLAETGALRVAVTTLDSILGEGSLPQPQVIKIDVEGAELAVLNGAQRLLSEIRPVLFLATHGADVHRECCILLKQSGYELHSLDALPVAETDELLAIHPAGTDFVGQSPVVGVDWKVASSAELPNGYDA